MTQPLSKSEEAAEFLWTVIRKRGCVDKEELRHVFVTKFAEEWSGRTAITRFYEALRRLEKAGKVYTHDDKICIVDEKTQQMKALFCDVATAIKYPATSKIDERFRRWVSNGRVVKYIFNNFARLSLYKGEGAPDPFEITISQEDKYRVVGEVCQWAYVLRAYVSTLNSNGHATIFVDDPAVLASLLAFLREVRFRARDKKCPTFLLDNWFTVMTTCRTAADVFLATSRAGGYIMFPVSGRVLRAGDPHYTIVLPCGNSSTPHCQRPVSMIAFGAAYYTNLIMPVRLALLLKYVRIVELEEETCDFCQSIPNVSREEKAVCGVKAESN